MIVDAAGDRLEAAGSTRAADGWYTLAVLITAYVFSFIDRQILSLLVEPLKRDLHLSDTQVSLLQGLVFAVVLTLAGLPIGRWVDTRRRVTIIALGVASWSVMTASCAFAASYGALLLCRAGVGVGEATLTPAAHSIITDIFPARRLGLVLGVFGVGSYIGAGLALLIGAGVIAHLPQAGVIALPLLGAVRPWRMAFLLIGLPGLLAAAWVTSLREPARRAGPGSGRAPADVWRYFRANARSILLVNLTAAFTGMAVYAANAWVPSFLIRTFHWTASQAGVGYGLIVIACGVTGMVGGGAVSDLVVARGMVSGRPLVMALAALAAAPFAMAAPLAAGPWLSLALMVPLTLLTTVALGVLPSTQQAMTPGRMRGLAAALGVLMVNLIALGLGPTAIALATDLIFRDPLKIRYSLAVLTPLMLVAGGLIGLMSLAPYRASIVRLDPAREAMSDP